MMRQTFPNKRNYRIQAVRENIYTNTCVLLCGALKEYRPLCTQKRRKKRNQERGRTLKCRKLSFFRIQRPYTIRENFRLFVCYVFGLFIISSAPNRTTTHTDTRAHMHTEPANINATNIEQSHTKRGNKNNNTNNDD